MAKTNPILIILILAVSGFVIYTLGHGAGLFAVTGAETMTRTLPATAEKGSTFTVTWNLVGASGTYGVLIEDTMAGGCKFSDGTTKFTGILFNPETSKSLTVTAPVAVGTCTFTGGYDLGNVSHKVFPTQTVSVICTPVWVSGTWGTCSAPTCDWTGKDACLDVYTSSGTQTRTVTDSSNCGVTTGQPATSQACSNSCTRTVLKNTVADTNCDNTVKKQELINYLQVYIDSGGTASVKTDLLLALQAWISGGGL